MTTDAPFQPHRKKSSVFWWLGGAFLLVVVLFFVQLFSPNPPIVVSPQTTYITAPLDAHGWPNYKQALLNLYRRGVTPKNNAAALIWPALWPGELDPSQYAAITAELGLPQNPSASDAATNFDEEPTRGRMVAWLRKQFATNAKTADARAAPAADQADKSNAPLASAEDPLVDTAGAVTNLARGRPWTAFQIPPLAAWVAENQKPLDKLVAASKRSHCYFPSPSLLTTDQEPVIATLLPGIQAVRLAGRFLPVRAMFQLGEGRTDDAWRDLLAVHRIGRLTAQGQTLVEQLVGVAIDMTAHDGTLALLDQKSLTAEQARQIQRDLAALPYFNGMADSIDQMERLSYLDSVIQLAVRNDDGLLSGLDENGRNFWSYMNRVRVNWNVALSKGNEYYDRLVAAARLPQRQARKQAISQIEADLNQLVTDAQDPASIVISAINPAHRNEAVAVSMLGIFLPALKSALDAQDRVNTMLELERLAAALAAYRAEHGDYPDRLEKVVPAVIEKLPGDLYNAAPYIYKRTADGYLLYTAGDNGNDDGGSNEMMRTFEGRTPEDLDLDNEDAFLQKIPSGADDWSIRMPRPQFSLPKFVATKGEQ